MAFSEIMVGDVVRVMNENSVAPVKMLGVVYERYRFASVEAVGIIFENGICEGWVEKEFDLCLRKMMHSADLGSYSFQNGRQLRSDFLRGVFADTFSMAANPIRLGGESLLW
jgi:hypothetical protein